MAIQLRRGDYTDFDPSRLLDGELAVVLENDPDTDDGTGTYVSYGDSNVKRLLTADEQVEVPTATTTTAGIVKPDGTSITVDQDGTIHGANTSVYVANSISWFSNTCSVTVDESFELVKGVVLVLVFSSLPSGLSAKQANACINVNSTGDKYIQRYNGKLRCTDLPYRTATILVYNGTVWEIVGDIDRECNKVLTAKSATAADDYLKTLDIKTYYNVGDGMILIVTFVYDNTAELSNLYLGVVSNASGSTPQYSYASIRKGGEVLTEADNLKAGIPYVFRYENTSWNLIGTIGDSVTPSSTAPLVDGTASAGSSTDYARADHVHPTDTSRASATDLSTHTGNGSIHVSTNDRATWNAKADESDLTSHTSDTTAHVTAAERATWDAKASTDTATMSANGLMSASDKSKLDGIGTKANGYYTTEVVNGDRVLTLVYDLVEE